MVNLTSSYIAERAFTDAIKYLSNEFSQHYWQESFDGDSIAIQSRFDAYVGLVIVKNFPGAILRFRFYRGPGEATAPRNFLGSFVGLSIF